MNIFSGKWKWTENDFEEMEWHDCHIHAFAYISDEFKFVLDIDYIHYWKQPEPDENKIKFWISPATLVLKNVENIVFDLSSDITTQINSLTRVKIIQPRIKGIMRRKTGWRWTIDCFNGTIRFDSLGMILLIRSSPQLCDNQKLDLPSRGGVSFLEE